MGWFLQTVLMYRVECVITWIIALIASILASIGWGLYSNLKDDLSSKPFNTKKNETTLNQQYR